MTAIPQAVTDYSDRLVDARKKAYVASCIACWNQGQPFVSEWPNLAAEYIQDIQRKLRRYGLTEIQRPEVVEAEPIIVEPVADTIVKCDECSQAVRTSEIINGKCPNPACWPGMAAYSEAYRDWSKANDAYVKAYKAAGYADAAHRFSNSWLTRNPAPNADHFRDGKRPKYAAWEVANVETKEEREARALAEKWDNPTVITRPNGESRILASVPEQQRLKLEAEIAKVTTARTLPDHRTYLRGKAYIGDVRGSVYDGRLQFEESIGGEKWAEAFKRQVEVAYIVDWYKKDGAKPGDFIPRTAMEARSLVATYGAEAAG